ncbi:MAG: hypothetical protein KC933_41210, partial [Myxococcales bacterium]|nr:hypothetical protein [Myxococcales bacterium]
EFGVPAVFAVLAARREVTATASGRARVAAVTRWMEENLEGFRSGLWELPRPIHRRVGLCAESFRSYLEGMTYRHGLPEEQGLERLREEATRLGRIEPTPLHSEISKNVA